MRYFAEFNRVIGDNAKLAARRLTKRGLNAQPLSHKTSMLIERPTGMPWSTFKSEIASVLQPRRGSVLIHSEKSGYTYICSNRGNRSGAFVRQ
jgi:hypothetical protein